ncbi:orph-N1 [Microplitis demolitor]|nr:orph-N1 [Microplitis demolitor]
MFQPIYRSNLVIVITLFVSLSYYHTCFVRKRAHIIVQILLCQLFILSCNRSITLLTAWRYLHVMSLILQRCGIIVLKIKLLFGSDVKIFIAFKLWCD